MPRFKFRFLPTIPLPSPAAIRDAIGPRRMFWTPEPLSANSEDDGYTQLHADMRPADHHTATIVTSRVEDSTMHMPLIDLDLPCMLLPSSQPGHFHLYIEKQMAWDKFVAILEALEDAGVVGPGYLKYTKKRGYATVRYPGVTKQNEAERIRETMAELGIELPEDTDLEDPTFLRNLF